jgi:phospholipid/cholesterol/gamma-HCH transport system substrate-binding protein
MLAALAKFVVAPLAVVVAGVSIAPVLYGGGNGYELTVVFPDAANLVRGGRVQIDGLTAGTIEGLRVQDGKALVRISVQDEHLPLHAGTKARIDYQALLGERIVALLPGSEKNAELPDGAILEGGAARIDFDQFLRTFDPETQERIRKAVPNLDSVLGGREAKVGETLEAFPPATEAIAQLLAAVGEDGPALRQLLTSLRDLSSRLVDRRQDIAAVVDGLEKFMTAGARRDEALAAGLDALPSTLQSAAGALDRLPGAAAAAVPLLQDLRPVADLLGPVASQLAPVLAELRPTLAAFRPALASLAGLLDVTPSLLATASGFLPEANRSLTAFLPTVDFLRPYAPEIAGAVANFASAAANYDRNGHYLRVIAAGSSSSFDSQPSQTFPSQQKNPDRKPGEIENQPWPDANHGAVDANGSPIR